MRRVWLATAAALLIPAAIAVIVTLWIASLPAYPKVPIYPNTRHALSALVATAAWLLATWALCGVWAYHLRQSPKAVARIGAVALIATLFIGAAALGSCVIPSLCRTDDFGIGILPVLIMVALFVVAAAIAAWELAGAWRDHRSPILLLIPFAALAAAWALGSFSSGFRHPLALLVVFAAGAVLARRYPRLVSRE